MHRIFNYDDTIREHHIFNPKVYIEDPDKRAGVALYLEGLGYDISSGAVGIGNDKRLSYDIISMNDIVGIDKWGNIGVGCYGFRSDNETAEEYKERIVKELSENSEKYRYLEIEDGEKIDLNPIACGADVELFKALALYRDDTDYGKLIYDPYRNKVWVNIQFENFEKDCYVEWVKERCKLLNTLEEILEHKDLL